MMGDAQQTDTLADRYFSVMMGDLGNLFVLFLQVPAISAIICVIWAGARPDTRLHLALCLSAIWLGLFNSCREVVKERILYDRERRLFLLPSSYLLSKVKILSIICAIQTAGLLWAVNYYVGLPGSKVLLFLTLFLAALGGVCLGLVVSCLVSTSDRAVALAPIIMLPQVFFSEGFMPSQQTHGVVNILKHLMLIEWVHRTFDHFLEVGRGVDWLATGLDLLALCAYILALLLLGIFVLQVED